MLTSVLPAPTPELPLDAPAQPGQILARGVIRHLRHHDFACLEEFVPERGKRLDVMGVGPKSELWVVECKSSRADFLSDLKWRTYLPFADRFFWAVGCDFPTEILPKDGGLIVADGFGAEVVRMPDSTPVNAARRRKLVHKFGRTAAQRLMWARDPMLGSAS